jgi:TolA-binding protein
MLDLLLWLFAQGPDLSLLRGLSFWDAVTYLLITGGLWEGGKVAVRYIKAATQRDKQEHQQDMDLHERLDEMQVRMSEMQEQIDEEIQERRKAQGQNARLRRQVDGISWKLDKAIAAIDHLIMLLNEEREAQGKETLDKEALRDIIPPFWGDRDEEGVPPYQGDVPGPESLASFDA